MVLLCYECFIVLHYSSVVEAKAAAPLASNHASGTTVFVSRPAM